MTRIAVLPGIGLSAESNRRRTLSLTFARSQFEKEEKTPPSGAIRALDNRPFVDADRQA
jgi:hypothetical protein